MYFGKKNPLLLICIIVLIFWGGMRILPGLNWFNSDKLSVKEFVDEDFNSGMRLRCYELSNLDFFGCVNDLSIRLEFNGDANKEGWYFFAPGCRDCPDSKKNIRILKPLNRLMPGTSLSFILVDYDIKILPNLPDLQRMKCHWNVNEKTFKELTSIRASTIITPNFVRNSPPFIVMVLYLYSFLVGEAKQFGIKRKTEHAVKEVGDSGAVNALQKLYSFMKSQTEQSPDETNPEDESKVLDAIKRLLDDS